MEEKTHIHTPKFMFCEESNKNVCMGQKCTAKSKTSLSTYYAKACPWIRNSLSNPHSNPRR